MALAGEASGRAVRASLVKAVAETLAREDALIVERHFDPMSKRALFGNSWVVVPLASPLIRELRNDEPLNDASFAVQEWVHGYESVRPVSGRLHIYWAIHCSVPVDALDERTRESRIDPIARFTPDDIPVDETDCEIVQHTHRLHGASGFAQETAEFFHTLHKKGTYQRWDIRATFARLHFATFRDHAYHEVV